MDFLAQELFVRTVFMHYSDASEADILAEDKFNGMGLRTLMGYMWREVDAKCRLVYYQRLLLCRQALYPNPKPADPKNEVVLLLESACSQTSSTAAAETKACCKHQAKSAHAKEALPVPMLFSDKLWVTKGTGCVCV